MSDSVSLSSDLPRGNLKTSSFLHWPLEGRVSPLILRFHVMVMFHKIICKMGAMLEIARRYVIEEMTELWKHRMAEARSKEPLETRQIQTALDRLLRSANHIADRIVGINRLRGASCHSVPGAYTAM